MQSIMMLVKSTSKSVEVYRQLVNAGGPLVFVQLVHDTDSDSLVLLLIKNFDTMEIYEVEFGMHNGPDIANLMERCGSSTSQCLDNVTSMFMSFEIENIVRKVYQGIKLRSDAEVDLE